MTRDPKKDAILQAAKTWQVEWTDQKDTTRFQSRHRTLDGQGPVTLDAFKEDA